MTWPPHPLALRLIWVLAAFCLLTMLHSLPTLANDFATEAAEISRLEQLLTEREYEAKQRARQLKRRLEDQVLLDSAFARDQHDRSEDWRRLANAAGASAEEARRKAEERELLAASSDLSDDERSVMRTWAGFDRTAAEEDASEAERRAARADEFAQEAAKLDEQIAAAVALINRLEAILGRSVPEAPKSGGDEVPVLPLWMDIAPAYDGNGYFIGWDATTVVTRFDAGEHFWDGDASSLRGRVVEERGETYRIKKENVARFFQQIAAATTGHYDVASGSIVQPDYVPHSPSGLELIEHWTRFGEETASTIAEHPIHKDQFEPFFREFRYEYGRIRKYQAFLAELRLRENVCKGSDTGVPEAERAQYCQPGSLPASLTKAGEFVRQYRSELYRAYGADPWKFMEEIAATSRPTPLRPLCIWVAETVVEPDFLAQFQAELEASEARSLAFWEEADQFYREQWHPALVVVEGQGEQP